MRKYWHCIVEVETGDLEIPDGGDRPMRVAVDEAAEALTGSFAVTNIYSGWGVSENMAKHLVMESCQDDERIELGEAADLLFT